jgi:hypothetical protein
MAHSSSSGLLDQDGQQRAKGTGRKSNQSAALRGPFVAQPQRFQVSLIGRRQYVAILPSFGLIWEQPGLGHLISDTIFPERGRERAAAPRF